MLAHKGRENFHPMSNRTHKGGSGTHHGWAASLCPNLRVFGLKYRRWLRKDEQDELTPLFRKIVETRSKTGTPLKSFRVWPTKDTAEDEAQELVT